MTDDHAETCKRLHQLFWQLPRLSFPFSPADGRIPKNGIYILFEKGETAHGGERIVRIGTHTGDNQLPSRLQQHFINENKDRSIFRKNIGRAILNKRNDPFLASWELDLTTKAAREKFGSTVDLARQREIEKEVSAYMQERFSFVVFRVDTKDDRLAWESKIISAICACDSCRPSGQWLGNYSPKEKIRESGLWLVNELFKKPLTQEELIVFSTSVLQK